MEENFWQNFVRLVKINSNENVDRHELLLSADVLAEAWMRTGGWPSPWALLEVEGFVSFPFVPPVFIHIFQLLCINSDDGFVQHQLTSLLMISIPWLDGKIFNRLRMAGLKVSVLLKLANLKWQACNSSSWLLMWPNVDGYTTCEPTGVAEDFPKALLDLSVHISANSNSSRVDRMSCLSLWLSLISTMKNLSKWNSFLRTSWPTMRSLMLTFLPSNDGYMVRTSMQILSCLLSVFIQDVVHKKEKMNENDVGFEQIMSLWEVVGENIENSPSRWFGGIRGPGKDPCSVRLLLLIPLQLSTLCLAKFDSIIGLQWFRRLVDVSTALLVASFSEEDEQLSMLLFCAARIFSPENPVDSLHPVALWLQFFESLHFKAQSIFDVLIGGDYSLLAFVFFLKALTQQWEMFINSPERICVYEWAARDQSIDIPPAKPAFTLDMLEIIDGKSSVSRRPVFPMAYSRQTDCQVPYSTSKIPFAVLMDKLKLLLAELKHCFVSGKNIRPDACVKLIDKLLLQIASTEPSRLPACS
ncbi:hypothetical protein TTRE_0000463701 [Trichuris trichiura]|uniref:Protein Lines N-terminal domain-containing protein n=1 Tax=Trichuris trichiura TaxID=36087 RepID=A0A077ZCM3_TRITR|nr:hypothetical protein TTRE_0000463701 [Trichuris trichiura]